MIDIKIIDSDIDAAVDLGIQYSSNFDCPLARAIKRMYPEATKIQVGGNSFAIDGVTYTFNHNRWNLESMEQIYQKEIETPFIVQARCYN